METQTKTGGNAKDFFINLGAIVALYALVVSLVNLLFTVINTVYPKITDGYYYAGSNSISWPVATLVIFFPVFILLMWLMEKQYLVEPERKSGGVHKWLTYITLFISGLVMVGDLITVLYYFLDGQELTAGFMLKVLVVFVVAGGVFMYYMSEVRDRLTPKSRKIWRVVAGAIVMGSIILGFSVLGSPSTQRLYKYDEQKVNDLMNINSEITNYYSLNGKLPQGLAELTNQYYFSVSDSQNNKPYEYEKISDTSYNLCAEFNKANDNKNDKNKLGESRAYPNQISWFHPAGRYCFSQTINPNMYSKPTPFR